MTYYNNDNKLTYPDLVMEQIKIIQKICSRELRDGDKILKNAMGEQIIEGDDTRYSFLQSVEVLGSMLSPYFGSSNIGFEEFCDYYDAELVEVMGDKEFIKKIDEIFGKKIDEVKADEGLLSQVNIFFLNDKIKEGRKMFRKLIKVFKENNFLGDTAYGETGSGDAAESLDAVDDSKEDILA